MAKLNDESHDILVNRRNDFVNKFKKEFAVVFMGDTHIGMDDGNNQVNYQKVLNRVVAQEKKDKNIIAAFDGGDLADTDNMTLMQTFKSTTENILFKKNSGDKIPLFGNIGNHEYIHNGAQALAYNALVGKSGDIQTFRLTPEKKTLGVILEVILLDTGGPDNQGFPDSSGRFATEIEHIKNFINKETKKYQKMKPKKHVVFIIDMHIPPKVGSLGSPSPKTPHFLSPKNTKKFLSLLTLKTTRDQIIAIITHHRHCKMKRVYPPKQYKKVPIYITTHAGQHTKNKKLVLEYLSLRLAPTKTSYKVTKNTKFVKVSTK